MALGPRLDLRQSQSLVMTPQLRQAIKLLQSSNVEVGAFVEEELERNPLLERDERPEPAMEDARRADTLPAQAGQDSATAAHADSLPAEHAAPLDADWSNVHDEGTPFSSSAGGRSDFADDLSTMDDLPGRGATRHEHLSEQIRLTFRDPQERLIASAMLAMLEPSGRLTVDVHAMAARLGCGPGKVEAVRLRLLRFDPVGMFAADLAECLAAQLAERNRLDPAIQALLDHLPLLARREHAELQRICAVDAQDLADMIAEIRRLDPKPGAGFDTTPAMPVQPDVLMRAAPEGGWLLELNPDTLPRVLINQGFAARCLLTAKRDDKTFISEKLQTANWLVKSLEQRANTILKVAADIVQRQEGFFRHGVEFLRPLILREVAETVEMHESTVSRVTANKYIATPRGILELKFFFTTAINGTAGGESVSAAAVRYRIKAMVDQESPTAILSDDAIVTRLRQEGVDIARRTVAKYRDALRIPSSVQRRREKEGKAATAVA